MNRLTLFAACLGLVPAAVRANDVPIPKPVVHQPLPVAPTVPPVHVADCGKVSGCPTKERCRLGLGGMLNPIRRMRDRGSECGACGRVSEENFCPSCGSRLRLRDLLARDGCRRDRRACWERVKDWFCFQPHYQNLVPKCQPIPYQAPLIAYFPHCQEPTIPVGPAPGCGPAPKCDPAGCAANGECAPAAPGRASRLAGLFGTFRPGKGATAVAAEADMTPIAPGLRFANPTSPPAPGSPPAGQQPSAAGSNQQPVVPASYTRQWPGGNTASARPFSNP